MQIIAEICYGIEMDGVMNGLFAYHIVPMPVTFRAVMLGLMIVQRIVRDHDGRLELMSHGGKGTTFRIWLPKEERMPRLLGVNTEDE